MIPIVSFTWQVRSLVSDFAVFVAIVAMVGMDAGIGLATPKLNVPAQFRVSCYTHTLNFWFD